jgi:hypothetical protein
LGFSLNSLLAVLSTEKRFISEAENFAVFLLKKTIKKQGNKGGEEWKREKLKKKKKDGFLLFLSG